MAARTRAVQILRRHLAAAQNPIITHTTAEQQNTSQTTSLTPNKITWQHICIAPFWLSANVAKQSIHSFITRIYIAPLQGYYSRALLTHAGSCLPETVTV
jgi:hypothetical protein